MNRYDLMCLAALGAFLFALTIVATGPSGGVALVLGSSIAASWIQAVGSIVAIIAAIVISNDGARRNRHIALEIQNREAAARIEVAIHVANQGRTLVALVGKRFAGGKTTLGEGDFDSVCRAIDGIELADLRSGRLVTALMTLRRLLGPIRKLNDGFEVVGGCGMPRSDLLSFRKELRHRAKVFNRTYDEAVQAAESALTRLSKSHEEPAPG